MDNNRIFQVTTILRDKVTAQQNFRISEALQRTDDNAFNELMILPYKSIMVTILFGIFLGAYGANRFYVGDKLWGFVKLFFGVLLTVFSSIIYFSYLSAPSYALEVADLVLSIVTMIYAIYNLVDIFLCLNEAKKKNFEMVMNVISRYPQSEKKNIGGDIFEELKTNDVVMDIFPDVFKK